MPLIPTSARMYFEYNSTTYKSIHICAVFWKLPNLSATPVTHSRGQRTLQLQPIHLMRYVLRDAFLHTTVVMRGYLLYFHVPVSFGKSGPSPLTSLLNNIFAHRTAAHWMFFCFSHYSLQTLGTVVRQNPRRSEVPEILKPLCLAPTIIPWSVTSIT